MDTTNIIEATFGDFDMTTTDRRYQHDRGQYIHFTDLELPIAFNVQVSNNRNSGKSETYVGSDNMLKIEDKWFAKGENVYVWLYLPSGDDGNRTMKVATIPVIRRPSIVEQEPTPEETDTIAELISQLARGVEAADTSAQSASASEASASASATSASESATASATSASESAQSATESAQSAAASAQSATSASQSATSASQSATSASQSASNASRDADRAEMAAAESGYMDVEIVNGRLIYTRTDNVNVDFGLVNGHLVMEA